MKRLPGNGLSETFRDQRQLQKASNCKPKLLVYGLFLTSALLLAKTYFSKNYNNIP